MRIAFSCRRPLPPAIAGARPASDRTESARDPHGLLIVSARRPNGSLLPASLRGARRRGIVA
jgi:hypothetical protein